MRVLIAAVAVVAAHDEGVSLLQKSVRKQNLQHLMPFDTQSKAFEKKMVEFAQASPNQTTRDFLMGLRVCGECKEKVRLGEEIDGGYVTCLDDLHPQAGFSFGVEGHDKWSDQVYERFGSIVHQFDCTVENGTDSEGTRFYKKCVRSQDNHENSTFGKDAIGLEEVLSLSKQTDAPQASLIAKIDIEQSEYAMFENVDLDILKKFKEVIFEFHVVEMHLHQELGLKVQKRFQDAGFRVTHIHGNNCCGMYNYGAWSIPQLLEVTYVQDAPALPECLSAQEPLPEDAKNIAGAPDLPPYNLDPSAQSESWDESRSGLDPDTNWETYKRMPVGDCDPKEREC